MLTALLENPDYGLAYASIALVDEDGQINKIRNPAEFCKSGWVTRDLFRKGFVSPVAVLIKSELLRGFYFDEFLLTAEDSDFFLRLSLKTRFLYVHNVTVSTRMSKNSICHETGLNYNRILSLERFYCRIDECKSIPSWIVRRKLGHQYRRVAKEHQKLKHKKAALYLYQKAIGYWPLDLRLYFGMLQVVLLDKNKDSDPAWRMPAFLSEPFRTNRFQSVG
jgi:hypothetical protein